MRTDELGDSRSPPPATRVRAGRALLVGALAQATLTVGLDLVPFAGAEGPWLRWLRTAADHPVRCALAFALLTLAVAPGPTGHRP